MSKYSGYIAAAALLILLGAASFLPRKNVPAGANASPPRGEEESVNLYAVMYHSVLNDPARTGEYVITPRELEADLIYLRDKGCTSVTPEDIISFADTGKPLPEKPVLITFDDGHLNNVTYALPLLEKYGMTAVINTVGAFTEAAERENDPNPAYAYLTRESAALAEKSGVITLGCHTYNMHSLNGRKGASRKSGESEESYRAALSRDTDRWIELFGRGAKVYAYPFGYISREGFETLRSKGFRILLTCREGPNTVSPADKDKLIIIDRYNRPGNLSSEEFFTVQGIS